MPSSFAGQQILLTGGTDGIGKAVLTKLLDTNPNKILVIGRSKEKWDEINKTISKRSSSTKVEFQSRNLSLMADVQNLANDIIQSDERYHIIIHCAGVMKRRRMLTSEGLEEVFAIQYLARYYLNQLLKPPPEEGFGRVVIVSAGGSIKGTKFDFENLQGEKFYNGIHALKHESIANDMQILDMARHETNKNVRWYNYGPGVVRTDLLKDMSQLLKNTAKLAGHFIGISADAAAKDIVELLLSEKESGLYVRGVKRKKPSSFRANVGNQQKLREISEQLVDGALCKANS
mmetsp:Transcript_19386/g.26604  ORF Transcript_19386/g.26604 Transcript_19386/m.26604 type:complete len:289 (-) Transcript_19386:293-1159(-)